MNPKRSDRKLPAITLTIFCIVHAPRAYATENDAGAWLSFSISDAFRSETSDTRWHYWVDSQARFFDPGSHVSQVLIRPGIGYRLTDNVKAWVGYGRFLTRNRSGTVADEDRYWQQVDWSAGHFAGGNLSMRARLEQRSVSVGEDIGIVLRVLGKYVRPIGTNGRNSLIIGIEPFVELNDTDWAGDSGLAQNRTFVGVGWRIGNSLSIETGYMNQYIWVDGGEDRSFHHGVLNFNFRP